MAIMAWSDVGISDLRVPSPERVAEAAYYDPRQRSRQNETEERRRRLYTTPKMASLFDLLFEEVDTASEIAEPVKRRLKHNLGRGLRRRTAPREQDDAPPQPHGHGAPRQATEEQTTEEQVKGDRAEKERADAEFELRAEDRILEARRIADQLRYCLAQHTETSRKVSTYLRALLVLTQPHYKPTLMIEV